MRKIFITALLLSSLAFANAKYSGNCAVGGSGTNTIGAVKVTDGTNTAAVKAASTAAVRPESWKKIGES